MEGKPIIVFSMLILFFVVVVILYSGYNIVDSSKSDIVLNEITESISLEQYDIDAFKEAGCNNLKKSDEYWIVDGCKDDDVYVKIYSGEEGYVQIFCSSVSDIKDRFMKVKDYHFDSTCLDYDAEPSMILDSGMIKEYNVCGLRLLFMDDECLLGVEPL